MSDASHKLEVDIYYLARSGVDIIETGWNPSVEKNYVNLISQNVRGSVVSGKRMSGLH
jgi:hypothetical protein